MSNLSIEYKGFRIGYVEHEDKWSSSNGFTGYAPTLSAAKKKVDATHRRMRSNASVPALELDTHMHKLNARPCTIVECLERRGWRNNSVEYRLASMARRAGNDRMTRTEKSMHQLVPDTPEAHAAIDRAQKLGREAEQLWEKYQEAIKAIPRITEADVESLSEIMLGDRE